MDNEKPKNNNNERKIELMNLFINSDFLPQPLHPKNFLAMEREFGIEVKDYITSKDFPAPIDTALLKSLETTQTLMFELVDKTKIFGQIIKQVNKIIYQTGSKERAKVETRFNAFYQLISRSSTFVLSVALHMLSMCNSFKELLDLLDSLLYLDAAEDFRKMLRFAHNDKIMTEPVTPLGIFIFKIVPMDISGIYAAKTDEDLMSAWKGRVSFCIGLAGVFSDMRDTLSNSKKNNKRNREG